MDEEMMRFLWLAIGLLAISVVVARWQFSQTRSIFLYIWYQHWKFKRLRHYQRNLDFWLFNNHQRVWKLKSRVLRPYYRVRNHDRVWAVRLWCGSLWFKYARLFVPKCAKHGYTLFGDYCLVCGIEKAQRKHRLQELTGKK